MHNIPAAPVIDGATHLHSGKVRDLYRLDDGLLLMVASDRISAYDFVLDTTIPDKGEILTRMSLWWFAQLADLVPHHVVSTDVPEQVKGRAVVCEELAMYPVECVARGYLTGSGLLDYQSHRRRSAASRCPRAWSRPAGCPSRSSPRPPRRRSATTTRTSPSRRSPATSVVETAERLRDLTLAVYARAEQITRERGLILADTKFEFGSRRHAGPAAGEVLVLADEVLTPDSSRYWPADAWEPGRTQASYDKQIVRNWLTSPASGWDRASGERPPALPDEVVERTRARYVEAFELLTGERF